MKRQILAMVALALCRSTSALESTKLEADKVVIMDGWMVAQLPAGVAGSRAKRRCWDTKIYRDEGLLLGLNLPAQLCLLGV